MAITANMRKLKKERVVIRSEQELTDTAATIFIRTTPTLAGRPRSYATPLAGPSNGRSLQLAPRGATRALFPAGTVPVTSVIRSFKGYNATRWPDTLGDL